MVDLSFCGRIFLEFSRNWGLIYKNTCYKNFIIASLHCYNQVVKIVTFISDYSVYYKNAFLCTKEKVSCEHCVNQNYKNKHFGVTKRVVQLEPCIAPSVPTFQPCPRMILNIMKPRNTVFQNLQQHTNVNYAMPKLSAFMLYVNTKTFNMEHNLDSERAILIWRT